MNSKLFNLKPDGCNSTSVFLPNGAIIHSTHIGLLPNTKLPHPAGLVHTFIGLNKVLLSLGQCCDTDMKIVLTKQKLIVVVEDESQEVMLQGSRSKID